MPQTSHTKAAESHETAAKAHRTAAEHHGKGDQGGARALREGPYALQGRARALDAGPRQKQPARQEVGQAKPPPLTPAWERGRGGRLSLPLREGAGEGLGTVLA